MAVACVPFLALLLFPLTASADNPPFRTVIDRLIPNTPGLTIKGGPGGCDLVLLNTTGQDIYLFDQSKPPKPIRFAAQPKSTQARPPVDVHLAGAWPCASLPAVTEDERWNNVPSTVLIWSLGGAVGAVAFKMQAHTEYDPRSIRWRSTCSMGGSRPALPPSAACCWLFRTWCAAGARSSDPKKKPPDRAAVAVENCLWTDSEMAHIIRADHYARTGTVFRKAQ